MNKKRWIIIGAVILCVCIVAVCLVFGSGRFGAVKLSLTDFQSNGEYVFKGIAWDTAEETTYDTLPFALTEDPRRVGGPEDFNFFLSKRPCKLEGQKAVAQVEFYYGGFGMISWQFEPTSDAKAWFEQLAAKSTELFGEATEIKETVKEKVTLTRYSWRTENSQFQLQLNERTSGETYIAVGLGKLPPPQIEGSSNE